MGNEQDREAVGAEAADEFEQAAGLAGGEGGGGFVEDQDPGPAVEGAGDFDQLAFAGREAVEGGGRGEVEADAIEEGASAVPESAAVDEREAGEEGQGGQGEVLGDRQVGEEIELLMDEGDARPPGVGGGSGGMRVAVDEHAAGVGAEVAAEQIQERGLSRAVFADQGGDAAGVGVEGHAGEDGDAEERLSHAVEAKAGRGLGGGGHGVRRGNGGPARLRGRRVRRRGGRRRGSPSL